MVATRFDNASHTKIVTCEKWPRNDSHNSGNLQIVKKVFCRLQYFNNDLKDTQIKPNDIQVYMKATIITSQLH